MVWALCLYVWSEDNTNKLLNCLDDTDWSQLENTDTDINTAADTFVSYLNFCMDECVITKLVTYLSRDKDWVTLEVRDLFERRNTAFNKNRDDYLRLKSETRNAVRHAKKDHAKEIEKKLKQSIRILNSQIKH